MKQRRAFSEALIERATRGKGIKLGPFALALIFQAVLLLGTVFVVVFVPSVKTAPEFTARKTIYLPQRELDHRMAVAQLQEAAARPVLMDRLTTSALLPDALPSLPAFPQMDLVPVERESSLIDAQGLLDRSGLVGALHGLKSETSRISILGVEDQAERFVIAVDISQSVVNSMQKSGVDIHSIREETEKLIGTLNSNTLFGLIQFSRQYDLFADYLVPATRANKAAALEWLRREFRTTGSSGRGWIRRDPNGIQSVLHIAFSLEPDVILVISDASFQRDHPKKAYENVPWDELGRDVKRRQDSLARPARIHFIGFGVKEEHGREMRSLVRRNGGDYREY